MRFLPFRAGGIGTFPVQLLSEYARVVFRRRTAVLGLFMIAMAVLAAVFAEYVAPYDPNALAPADRLSPPSRRHWLGTDDFGRDAFSRMLNGARVSLAIGALVAGFACLAGMLIGMFAGYYRSVDGIFMRVMDGIMAFPGILLAIAIMAALGARVSNVIIALSVVYVPRVARVMRGSVLVAREAQYVEAALALGQSEVGVLLRHILPNCISPLVVQVSFIFANAVLGEASLSFLGAGVPSDVPSWGTMLSEGRLYMQRAPWLTVFPGIAVLITVLGLNLLGDGLRDALDPRFRKI